MAELFNIRLETDLSEFDSTVTDGGDLSQGSPGLAGTLGKMECLIDDTVAIYGHMNISPPVSGEFGIRIYIDPNSLTISDGDWFQFVRCQLSGSPWNVGILGLRYSGGSFQIRGEATGDGGWAHVANVNISDAEHFVEMYVKRATNAISNDGEYRWWIDGVEQDYWQDIDNYDAFALLDGINFGAPSGLSAGTSGTFYLDEIVMRDDNTEIGPFVLGNPWNYYAQM